MVEKSKDRHPELVDPFEASFGTPSSEPATPEPAIEAPVAATGSPADAFEASFGPLGPDGTPDASRLPPKAEDLGAASALTGSIIESLPIVGPAIKRGVDRGVAYLRSWSSGQPVEEELKFITDRSKQTVKEHPNWALAGEVTGQVAGYGLAAAAAPAAFGVGAASLPVAGMTAGATNALIAGADAYMRGQDPAKAAAVGGTLGAFAPVLGRAVGNLFTSYIEPEVARLADLAINRFGIPLGPDLISTNPMVRFASSVLERMPLTGGGASRLARQRQFNRAVAEQMGEAADSLTPDVMRRARVRIGNDFEYAARNTPQIGADKQFGDDLTRILDDIRQPVDRALATDERRVVEGHLRRVVELFNRGNGSITGQQYQQLTRHGTALHKAMESQNPNIRHYAVEIKGALDAALNRFAPADAAERLAQARRQWWAMKTVEDLAAKSPRGDISPALLKGRVDAHTHDMAYGGGGDMAELARIGDLFLKEAVSSGTAERTLIMKALSEIASTGGLWALFSHPIGAVVGAIAPVAVGQASRLARSPYIGNRLVQSSIHGAGPMASGAFAGGRAALPGLVQQARPLGESYLPDNRTR